VISTATPETVLDRAADILEENPGYGAREAIEVAVLALEDELPGVAIPESGIVRNALIERIGYDITSPWGFGWTDAEVGAALRGKEGA
jgi:hypothetical protein